MSLVKNTDYKTILFTRSDNVRVSCIVSLINPANLNENFLVLKIEDIDTPEEIRLFYWINQKRWTLNEFSFFALNNNLCLKVLDKLDNELASFGACGIVNRVFGFAFGINFN